MSWEQQGEQISTFEKPLETRSLVKEVSQARTALLVNCCFFIPPEPPTDLPKQEQKLKERERVEKLEEAVKLIDPERSEKKNWFMERVAGRRLIASMEETVDSYNRKIFDASLELTGQALFGNPEGVAVVLENISQIAVGKTKEQVQTTLETVQERIKSAFARYEEAPNDPELQALFADLAGHLAEKFPGNLLPATALVETDLGKNFYLPQLNTFATLNDDRLSGKVTPHLKIQGFFEIPLTDNLYVLPSELVIHKERYGKEAHNVTRTLPEKFDDYLQDLVGTNNTANPEDVIVIPGAIPDDLQIRLMLKDGDPFRPKRKELLEAGFVFLNAVGEGAKPVIKDSVLVDGRMVDLGKKPLLTQEELDASILSNLAELQQAGIPEEDISRIAMDMADFLNGPYFLANKRFEQIRNSLKSEGLPEAKVKELAKKQLESEIESGNLGDYNIRQMPLQPFYVVRGLENLNGHPCPCLNCGHRFFENNDLSFVKDGKVMRINTVVAHLAAHGISERGDSLPASNDQYYMTMLEYYVLMMKQSDPMES